MINTNFLPRDPYGSKLIMREIDAFTIANRVPMDAGWTAIYEAVKAAMEAGYAKGVADARAE